MKTVKVFSKQLFGAKYESIGKSMMVAAILYFSIHASGIRLVVAPFILYLTSTYFTAGVMWQMLTGRNHLETLKGVIVLPIDNHSIVFSYILVLGLHTLVTKTLLIWTLFFAFTTWSRFEIAIALLCGIMACIVASAAYRMRKKGNFVVPILWSIGILSVILLIRQSKVLLFAILVCVIVAVLYLLYMDAYDFYNENSPKKNFRYRGRTGNVFVYLVRYLIANKSYLVNTAGLCMIAYFLPILFGEFRRVNMFPIGLAILCLNTPICTLLSCDPDLEQAVRALPRQIGRFCMKYCLFIFCVNGIIACIYLLSWQIFNSEVGIVDIGTVILFELQSAILSVFLEWKVPIRGWKTETDLWHNPRKYIVPVAMLLIAAFVGTWKQIIWIWGAIIIIECYVIIFMARRK